MDCEKPLPTAINLQTHSTHPKGEEVHQSRHQMGVQQHLNQERRQTQSCIHHKPRAVQTYGYVLWTNKLPCYLPDDDECNFC